MPDVEVYDFVEAELLFVSVTFSDIFARLTRNAVYRVKTNGLPKQSVVVTH